MSVQVLFPPPDSPNAITLLGSPPNVAMFSLTQERAATMSSIPWLPEVAYSSPPSSPR